jgi:hypothetical protein
MSPKSFDEAARDLHDALDRAFWAVAEAIRLPQFAAWLNRKLDR